MSTYNQGNPSVSQVISASNVFVYGNTRSGNAPVGPAARGGECGELPYSDRSFGAVRGGQRECGVGTTNPQYPLDIAGQPRYSIQPVLQATQLGISAGAAAGWYRITGTKCSS